VEATSGAGRIRGRLATAGRVARGSRIPAVTALVLAAVVIAIVGLLVSTAPRSPTGAGGVIALSIAGTSSSTVVEGSAAQRVLLVGALPATATKVQVPILMYHYVDETPPPAGPYADELTVRTGDFEAEMKYLNDNGYHTVSLADAYLAMAGLEALPSKPVVLTFDDGGLDNYLVAFPLLKKHGLTATFFIITGTVGKDGQMDWDQLREMAASGMAIQSHTVSHPDLRGIPAARLEAELADSRAAITQAVAEPGYVLCYPGGAYDQRVIEAAKAAGYVMAVATGRGKDLDPKAVFEIKRRRVQAFLPLTSFARLVR
jgi:peptidoglycan/xylan/chitin deacetylase (PgdA/CDA1 family)